MGQFEVVGWMGHVGLVVGWVGGDRVGGSCWVSGSGVSGGGLGGGDKVGRFVG